VKWLPFIARLLFQATDLYSFRRVFGVQTDPRLRKGPNNLIKGKGSVTRSDQNGHRLAGRFSRFNNLNWPAPVHSSTERSWSSCFSHKESMLYVARRRQRV